MRNSSLLIFSIIKKLEIYTFKTLKLGNDLEKAKQKLEGLKKEGTVKWIDCSATINRLTNKLQKSMDISNAREFIYKQVPSFSYNKTTPLMTRLCGKIFNDIENCYYTHDDLIIAYLYMSMFENKKIYIKRLNHEKIKEIRKLFTKKQFDIDLEFMKSIQESVENTDILVNFRINNDGESIIYNLIKKEFITPIFYLYYYKKYLTKVSENINLKGKEYLHFERLNNIIFNFLK